MIEEKQPLILIVDDTVKNLQLLGSTLKENNYKIAIANNGNQAIAIARETHPDLILLDVMMPELDGFETCKKLQSLDETRNIPVIFLTAKTEMDDIVKGFKTGAVDYVTKPFNMLELKARVKTHIELKISKDLLKEKNEILKKLSVTDGLTGLYNHRYIIDTLSRFIEESKRYGQLLSISMIDIDSFKTINDSFGHSAGDEVLIKLSSIVEDSLRKIDYVGRYGGEEFLVILNHTDLKGAVESIERTRSVIEKLEWKYKGLKVTISAGVCQRKDEEFPELLKLVDKCLYEAKKSGRNKVAY